MAIAGVLAVAAGGAVIVGAANGEPSGQSAAVERGLSVKHMSAEGMAVDRNAQAGAANVFEIENNSKAALAVTVKARPWTQSSSGLVSPNRRRELSSVGLSDAEFTLAKGEMKSVTVTLRDAASVYGALEIIGLPADVATRKGVVAGYRIVSSLRYNPAARKYSLKAGAAKMTGSGSTRALALTIRNTGNTAEPVTGSGAAERAARHAQRVDQVHAHPAGQERRAHAGAGQRRCRPAPTRRRSRSRRPSRRPRSRRRSGSSARRGRGYRDATSISMARVESGAPQSSSEAGAITP